MNYQISKKYIVAVFVILSACCSFAQQNVFNIDSINNHFLNKFTILLQEKIHIHTDRSLYMQGEQIWFRIYLVDAVLHRSVFNSRYVYVELVNQQKNVVVRVKICPVGNSYYGNINLSPDLTEGEYTLRNYSVIIEGITEDGKIIRHRDKIRRTE
jgi:hypothetical protein